MSYQISRMSVTAKKPSQQEINFFLQSSSFFRGVSFYSNLLNKESMNRPLIGINRLFIVNTLHVQFCNLSLKETSLGFAKKNKNSGIIVLDQYIVFKPERRDQQGFSGIELLFAPTMFRLGNSGLGKFEMLSIFASHTEKIFCEGRTKNFFEDLFQKLKRSMQLHRLQ